MATATTRRKASLASAKRIIVVFVVFVVVTLKSSSEAARHCHYFFLKLGACGCLSLLRFRHLINSYQITDTKPMPIQVAICSKSNGVNKKKRANGGTYNSNPVMATVTPMMSSTRLFLYFKVVRME
jgi:hypothetical protein